jgi:hypothetical protein
LLRFPGRSITCFALTVDDEIPVRLILEYVEVLDDAQRSAIKYDVSIFCGRKSPVIYTRPVCKHRYISIRAVHWGIKIFCAILKKFVLEA